MCDILLGRLKGIILVVYREATNHLFGMSDWKYMRTGFRQFLFRQLIIQAHDLMRYLYGIHKKVRYQKIITRRGIRHKVCGFEGIEIVDSLHSNQMSMIINTKTSFNLFFTHLRSSTMSGLDDNKRPIIELLCTKPETGPDLTSKQIKEAGRNWERGDAYLIWIGTETKQDPQGRHQQSVRAHGTPLPLLPHFHLWWGWRSMGVVKRTGAHNSSAKERRKGDPVFSDIRRL